MPDLSFTHQKQTKDEDKDRRLKKRVICRVRVTDLTRSKFKINGILMHSMAGLHSAVSDVTTLPSGTFPHVFPGVLRWF